MSFEFDPARIWADLRRTEDRVDRGDGFWDGVLNAGKSSVRYGAEHASAIRFGSMSALGFSSRGDLMFDLFEDHYARVKRLEKAFALSGPMALDLLRTDLASLNVSAILDQLLETAQDIALYYAGSMAVGGFLGGVLGSLAGGVGAAPGAVLGVTLGIEACTVVLGIQGMVEVLTTLSQIITDVSACYVEGVVEAWGATPQDHENAPPGMFLRSGNAHFASEHFAHGHALIIKALLIALIGYVAGRAVSSASKALRLEEIASNSHLGKPVAQWLEKNQDALPQYAERLERTTAKPSTPDVPEPEVSSLSSYRGKETSSSSPEISREREPLPDRQPAPPTPKQLAEAKELGVDPKWVNPDGSVKWPLKGGFASEPEIVTLKPGTRFDRYGGKFDKEGKFQDPGRYVAPGGTPFGQRSLPSSSMNSLYREYEVLKPIPDVKSGPAAPWFDQPGGGIQHKLPMEIGDLIDRGFIRPIGK